VSASHPRASSELMPLQPSALAERIAAAMRALPVQNTPAMREVRRAYSKRINSWEAE